MRDVGIDEPQLLQDLSQGLKLVSRGADTPEFPAQNSPLALSVSKVRGASKWVRAVAR